MQFPSDIKSASVFGEVNSQTSKLALISYGHLRVTPALQYLTQPTDHCIRMITCATFLLLSRLGQHRKGNRNHHGQEAQFKLSV